LSAWEIDDAESMTFGRDFTVQQFSNKLKRSRERGKRGKDKKPRKRRTDNPVPFINSATAWDDRTLERGGHSDW